MSEISEDELYEMANVARRQRHRLDPRRFPKAADLGAGRLDGPFLLDRALDQARPFAPRCRVDGDQVPYRSGTLFMELFEKLHLGLWRSVKRARMRVERCEIDFGGVHFSDWIRLNEAAIRAHWEGRISGVELGRRLQRLP
jgi:hypothetical protein